MIRSQSIAVDRSRYCLPPLLIAVLDDGIQWIPQWAIAIRLCGGILANTWRILVNFSESLSTPFPSGFPSDSDYGLTSNWLWTNFGLTLDPLRSLFESVKLNANR